MRRAFRTENPRRFSDNEDVDPVFPIAKALANDGQALLLSRVRCFRSIATPAGNPARSVLLIVGYFVAVSRRLKRQEPQARAGFVNHDERAAAQGVCVDM